tara:strand:- start:130 stop:522 length:393 start_codon:yes stop_codon:yes gene_type:complete
MICIDKDSLNSPDGPDDNEKQQVEEFLAKFAKGIMDGLDGDKAVKLLEEFGVSPDRAGILCKAVLDVMNALDDCTVHQTLAVITAAAYLCESDEWRYERMRELAKIVVCSKLRQIGMSVDDMFGEVPDVE